MSMARRTVVGAAAAIAGGAWAGRFARAAQQRPLRRLAAGLGDRLITPGDQDYDALRRVHSFNPETDRRPAAIAPCHSATEVALSVSVARDAGLEIAVRSGGCDLLGASDCQGGLVIDLGPMNRLVLDARPAVARVGPGLTSGALARASASTGLAPVLGCHPAVGVGGLALGGGIGWLAGAQGAACDHLLEAEVVTADGRIVQASPEAHPELFWAIRGGGGNFGVVTSLELRLAKVDQAVGGTVAFGAQAPDALPAFLRFYRDYMRSAADPLTVELNFGLFAGAPAIFATACWSGDAAAGLKALAPLRSYGKPLFDSIRVGRYVDLAANAPPLPPNLFWRGASLDELGDGAIATLAAAIERAPPGWSIGMGHFVHGALAHAGPDATAMPRRPGQMTYFVGAGWGDHGDGGAGTAWVRSTMAAMRPHSSAATYINYLSDDSEEAVRAAYGPAYARLRAIKRAYDPDNVFHRNRNIRP